MEMKGAERLLSLVRAAQGDSATMQALTQSVTDVAVQTLAESMRIVPVDTGVLKGSAGISKPTVTPDLVEVELSYGGAAAPYALIVHEDMTMSHQAGKQAKYLETPVKRMAPIFVRKVQEAFLGRLRRMK
jgi:hypothetical protein